MDNILSAQYTYTAVTATGISSYFYSSYVDNLLINLSFENI